MTNCHACNFADLLKETICAHFRVQEVSVLWGGKFHIALVFERWNVEHRT